MIELKTPGEIDAIAAAGAVVGSVLTAVARHAAPGVTPRELDAVAADLIDEAGATSSFLGYHPSWAPGPYPAVLIVSINDAVVHGVPDDRPLRDGDLFSVDFAVHLDGWCADAAFSAVVGRADPADTALVETAERALSAGVAAAVPGARLGDVANAIGTVGRAGGYGLLADHGGHGLGRSMHEDPHVPNEGRAGRGLVLRPGLVLAPSPFGGTALLRGLAGFPGLIPAVHADAVVQVVGVEDVAEAVARAIRTELPARFTADLVAAEQTRLGDVLPALRGWLGFRPARLLALPPVLSRLTAAVADGLALLGWRSPMRSTAVAQLAAGVQGRAADPPERLGFTPRALDDILAGTPSGVQDRWFARLYFLKPLVLATLAAFWVVSGLIGFVRPSAAAEVLTSAGFEAGAARACVLGGAVVDIALGALACARATAAPALLGMIAVSAAYLAGATLWRPDLWLDPLGPLVKAVPSALLALCALAVLDER